MHPTGRNSAAQGSSASWSSQKKPWLPTISVEFSRKARVKRVINGLPLMTATTADITAAGTPGA